MLVKRGEIVFIFLLAALAAVLAHIDVDGLIGGVLYLTTGVTTAWTWLIIKHPLDSLLRDLLKRTDEVPLGIRDEVLKVVWLDRLANLVVQQSTPQQEVPVSLLNLVLAALDAGAD